MFRFPALRLSPELSGNNRGESGQRTELSGNSGSRVSAYDNVINNNKNSTCLNGSNNSDNDDTQVNISFEHV